jgi:uncharacterized membrane protein
MNVLSCESISTDMSQSIKDTSTSVSKGEEEKRKEYYPAAERQTQQKNLKILIPIIIVAVVGSIIALAVFNTTPTERTTNFLMYDVF